MVSMVKQIHAATTLRIHQYFFLLAQMALLSGMIIILFDALWSVTIFLPLSVGVEIVAKFFITHVIEHFLHHR